MPLKSNNKKKTVLDLFCGCGGMSTGFQQAGFKIVAGVDNWKFAQETYEHAHPGTTFILQDMKEFDGKPWKGKIDVVIGGPPCNFFSKARGKQEPEKGMELVNEFFRIIEEVQPRYWIGENVPDIQKQLPNGMFSKIHNCADYGVPQLRKRCFYGNYHVPEPTHDKLEWVTVGEVIGDIIEIFERGEENESSIPNLEKTESSQETMKYKMEECEFGMQKRYRNFSLDKQSYVISDMHGDSQIIKMKNGDYRRFSVRENARIQSFSDNFVFKAAKTNNYAMIGKAVPPLISKALAEALLENW